MFATIRKHQTWLFGFIIAAVIVSFVIYFTPTVRRDRSGGRRSSFGTMNGRPISRAQYFEAYIEAKLGFLLRYGTWPDQSEARKFGFIPEREARNRLVLISKLDEMDIKVDDSTMAQWVLERFSDSKSPASAKANYEAFVKQQLPRYGVTEAEFQKYIQHDVGAAHLVAVAGVAGKLVTPREAAALYRQENEQVESEAVVFSSTNYLGSVKVTPEELAQFYTNRQSVYRVPDRVQVNYVKFEMTNFYAQADTQMARNTNLAFDIDRAYLASGPNFFVETNGQVMPPEAAKAKLRRQERDRQALLAARKAAAAFATELETIKPVKAENLNNLAAAKGLVASVTEGFTEFDGPRSLKVRANFTESAFRLSAEEPYSSPLVAEDGVYLISLKQNIKSEVPPLDIIRGRVTQDFTQYQATQLARQAATNFLTLLTNGLAQGKTFAALCADGQVTPIALPKFSRGTRTLPDLDRRLDVSQLQMGASGIAPGKVSGLRPTRDGAFVLHVKARTPVPETELKQQLPKYLADLRQSQQFDAFSEWFRKQVELARLDTLKGRDEEE